MCKRISGVLALLLMATLIMFASCGGDEEPEEHLLQVTITDHPQGGLNVQSVDCTFEGEIVSGSGTIQVTIEWWWEDALGLNDQVLETNYENFDHAQPVSQTTTFMAPVGLSLTNYFWVELSWTDDEWPHTIESNKAFCTITDGMQGFKETR